MKAIKKTALAAAVAALMLLTACTGNTETGGNKTEKGIKITKTAAMTVQTEKYESTDFSITIPKGWKVETGGVNIYHSIRVRPAGAVESDVCFAQGRCFAAQPEG